MNLADEVRVAFEPGGLVADIVGPGYRVRRGQAAAAVRVAEAMADGDPISMLLEAGTGTGKTFLYLVPAFAHAARGKRTLVLTSSLALMDQVAGKDAPAVAAGFPGVRWAVVKGLDNYLCRRLADDADGVGLSRDERVQAAAVQAWAATTAVGDVAELPFVMAPRVRATFTTSSATCRGDACSWYADCLGVEAKRRAMRAAVVVANYHLVLALAARSDAPKLLAGFDAVVCDEAHEVPTVARHALGVRVSEARISAACRFATPGTRAAARRDAATLLNAAGRPEQAVRLRPGDVDGSALAAVLVRAGRESAEAQAALSDIGVAKDVEQARVEIAACVDAVDEVSTQTASSNAVWYAEGDSVCSAMINPGPALQRIWDMFRVRLFTSATLRAGSAGFRWIARDLGLRERETVSARVASPFAYPTQMGIYVPRIPAPTRNHAAVVAAEVARVAAVCPGRILCLHTSYGAMRAAAAAVSAADPKRPVRMQGDAPKNDLTTWLSRSPNGILLGVDSLWTGVDVPGLSVVVIDRIPFSVPGDPISEALKERLGDSYFHAWAVPRAMLRVQQGVGRLIRRISDRGVVAILDSRFVDGSFRRACAATLPPGVGITRNLAEVERIVGGSR